MSNAEQETALYDQPDTMPSCDAHGGCSNPVAYVTNRGWLTCREHWTPRDRYSSSRLLRPAELRKLARGESL